MMRAERLGGAAVPAETDGDDGRDTVNTGSSLGGVDLSSQEAGRVDFYNCYHCNETDQIGEGREDIESITV
jgi:hypothetical protein